MTPEGKVKAKIVKILKAHRDAGEAIYWFSPIGSVYGKSGVPDIIVCYRGGFIGVEVKAPGKLSSVTPLQTHSHELIRRAGGVVLLTDNAEQVEELLTGEGESK